MQANAGSAEFPNCDVVVIGGGVSGLFAARQLAAAGVSCICLEARDRVGGRTLSQRLNSTVIDLGGQWIGPTQLRLLRLSGELGVKTFPQFCTGKKILSLGGDVSTYKAAIPSLPLIANLELGWTMFRWDRMRRQLDLERPWAARRAVEWDSQTVETWKRRHVRTSGAKSLVDIAVRAVFCGEPNEVSLLFFLHYLNSAGGLDPLTTVQNGAQQDRFVGGMQQISERMADELAERVVLNAPVRAIEQNSDGVVVRTDAGDFHASYCIIAIPPALASRIHYEPSLPARRDHLSQRMPMGSVIKYVIAYDTPFWRQAGFSGEIVSDRGPIGLAFDATSHDGSQPAIVGFTDGGEAHDWAEKSAEHRRRAVLEQLASLFGQQALSPSGYAEKSWIDDPWSRGCYVGLMPPGVMTTLGSALREPCGRIHWAGTETATEWTGYIDGAIQAGGRAADEVLQLLRSRSVVTA